MVLILVKSNGSLFGYSSWFWIDASSGFTSLRKNHKTGCKWHSIKVDIDNAGSIIPATIISIISFYVAIIQSPSCRHENTQDNSLIQVVHCQNKWLWNMGRCKSRRTRILFWVHYRDIGKKGRRKRIGNIRGKGEELQWLEQLFANRNLQFQTKKVRFWTQKPKEMQVNLQIGCVYELHFNIEIQKLSFQEQDGLHGELSIARIGRQRRWRRVE